MVGILIIVWVWGDFRLYICDFSVFCVGCGVMGCLGNKVIILKIFIVLFCFLNFIVIYIIYNDLGVDW